MTSCPPISFGIIVLNGEPFTRYCLRALYPMAHEILVVEGAAPAAKGVATADGHSRDGTLEVLRRFKAEEDPEGKLTIITAEDEGHDDGFWPGEKDQMSQAYARRATGRYLWQVDVDEFYKPTDMRAVIQQMEANPQIHAASFKQIQFWGGFSSYVDSWRLRAGAEVFHRLFRYDPGHRYLTHRPPTVCDAQGHDLRQLGHLDAHRLAEQGIYLYHYSFVFPRQVREKCEYYRVAFPDRLHALEQWARDIYTELRHPFRVDHCGSPSWLNRFEGEHPAIIQQMQRDLEQGELSEPTRLTDDIDALLSRYTYRLGRAARIALVPLYRSRRRLKHWTGIWIRRGSRWHRQLVNISHNSS